MENSGKCNCNRQSHCRSEAARMQSCPCNKCKEKRRLNEQLRGMVLDQHRQSIGPSGANNFNNSAGAQPFTGFANGNVNFCITFLLEIVGILIFFAIATLMFWVGVCYYSFKLAVKVKNANRNTQYAVAGLGALLLLLIMVTVVRNQNCSDFKNKSCSRKPPPPPPKKKTKCLSPCEAKAKAKPVKKCADKPKPKPPQCGMCKAKPKAKPCAKASAPPCANGNSCKPKRVYTDCEGRRIYENSKRYAIPTEMKQPPSLLVYIQNWISRRFGSE